MFSRMMFSIGAILGLICEVVGPANAGVCLRPVSNLGRQTSSPTAPIDSEVVNLAFRSKMYTLDLRSGYVAGATPSSNYCIRYEVTSNSFDAIEKFYWPLPNIQADALSRDTVSLVVTKPPGPAPALDETWLFAFLNSSVRSVAFQIPKRSAWNAQKTRLAFNGGEESLLQLASIEPVEERLPLKKAEFEPVGANFSVGKEEDVSATTTASWDGKRTSVRIFINKNNDKSSVVAPVTYALMKSFSASSFLEGVRAFEKVPLPMEKNAFEATASFEPAQFGGSDSIYVVEQPITVITPGGRWCYSSPTYVPMPLPPELLRCQLF